MPKVSSQLKYMGQEAINPISILPLDQCFGHPYSQQYHLHAYSWKCLPNQGTTGQSPLLGYALDGFGIYGPRGADGKEITNAQLDECHGMTSPVLFNGKIQNIYHYVLNSEFPYSVGCFRGVVDPANVHRQLSPGGWSSCRVGCIAWPRPTSRLLPAPSWSPSFHLVQ